MKLRILRTGAGSPVAPGVIRHLRSLGDVEVVAADMDPLSVGFSFANNSVVVPCATSAELVPRLLDVCSAEKIDVLFPDVDEEFLPIVRAKAAFSARGVRILLSSELTIETCTDKLLLSRALTKLGIACPEVYRREDAVEGRVAFPVFVKPREGRGSRGAYRADDFEALTQALSRLQAPVVQELVSGNEYTIDTLCSLEGRFLYASVRERLSVDSGVSIKGRTVSHPDLERLAGQVAEGLGIIGPGCLQCIVGPDGRARFIDCNPRLGGGTLLSVAAGADVIGDTVRLLRGEPIRGRTGYRPGLTMVRRWEETFLDPLRDARAVLFDLDNTLYDQSVYILGALADVAERIAAEVRRPREPLVSSLVAAWRARGTDEPRLFNLWLRQEGAPEGLVELCVRAFHSHVPAKLELYPGITQLLQELRTRRVKTAIVTDGNVAMQRRKISALGLAFLVDVIVLQQEYGSAKPDPCGMREALRQLDVNPGSSVFVGDHPEKDVAMAKAIDVLTVRVLTGEFHVRPDLPGARPDVTLTAASELLGRIGPQS